MYINARHLISGNPTGTHRASDRLLRELAAYFSRAKIVSPDIRSDQFDHAHDYKVHVLNHFLCTFHHQLWEQFYLPWISKKEVILNLMGTGQVLFGASRNIMVVYDLNFILIKESFNWKLRLWFQFAILMAARKARHVFTISNYSKQILAEFGVPEEKISVFYPGPGINPDLLSSGTESRIKDKPYILCVGSLQPHKNLIGILKTFKKISASQPDMRLLIVGKKQSYFNSVDGIDKFITGSNVEFTGYLTDEMLAELYRNAEVLLFPSFEEGFGLPIVEAFYAGCPVVTSKCSCLPEIAGDAAALVDPHDHDEMASAVLSIIRDAKVRDDFIQKGFERSRKFTWKDAGETVARKIAEL
ncbi:MAG: glycosyltransferase family 1 protein [Verrucomicrobiota bacterium]